MSQVDPKHIAVIVAAGRGRRMGADVPKVFLDLAGKPVLAHTLERFMRCQWMDAIILVVGAEYIEQAQALTGSENIRVVAGGQERTDSVRAGLAAAGEWLQEQGAEDEQTYVYIHDGARPLVSSEVLERVKDGVLAHDACVCGMPVKDTVRTVDKDYLDGMLARDSLRLIQTPQAFRLDLITAAYAQYSAGQGSATDDAQVYEAMTGKPVAIVAGSYINIKLTTPEDMKVARVYLEECYGG